MSLERVFDAELHPLIESREQLLSHVADESWRERLRSGEFGVPAASPHPGAEVEGVKVREAATDPAAVAAALGDEVEAAMLVPAQAMTTAGWLNHGMAATF